MSPATNAAAGRKARASRHAGRWKVCACGRVTWGNGGTSSHRRACAAWSMYLAARKAGLLETVAVVPVSRTTLGLTEGQALEVAADLAAGDVTLLVGQPANVEVAPRTWRYWVPLLRVRTPEGPVHVTVARPGR